MNEAGFELVAGLVGKAYATQAADARRRREKRVRILLQQRKLPENGWDDQLIELFLYEISVMDSNNFVGNVGVGEREARVASALVARRHYGLGHGVGRSGDIAAIQPKAAGSSLMARLTESLALDLIRLAGIKLATACIVLPLATGMGLVMTLLTLRARRPGARFVIWPRIDQKSCFKAISTAGFVPVVIQNKLKGDEVVCDVEALESKVMELGPENVLAVVTTTSCFAPRTPDPLPEIAKFCKDKSVPHVVNNAYGLQSSKCCFLVNEAIRVGRLDAFVSSTDKNLLVPVGGSLVASPDPEFVAAISKTYPGRASGAPALDVFITLLSLGSTGYTRLLTERKRLYTYLQERLVPVAEKHGERVLKTRGNGISMGITLSTLAAKIEEAGHPAGLDTKFFGSMLFSRSVSGTRVVTGRDAKSISGVDFVGYGAHVDTYPSPYLTVAAAIGMVQEEADVFIDRLDKAFMEFDKKLAKAIKTKKMSKATDEAAAAAAPTAVDSVGHPPPPIATLQDPLRAIDEAAAAAAATAVDGAGHLPPPADSDAANDTPSVPSNP